MQRFIKGIIIERFINLISSVFNLPSTIVLLLSNLFPVFGMLLLGWDITNILILYWMENLIIGFYNVIRMIVASKANPQPYMKDISSIIFFIIHYGIFTFGHGRALIVIIAFTINHEIDLGYLFLQNLLGFFLLFISHGFSLIYNYLYKQEYLQTTTDQLFFKPYGRVAIMHLSTTLSFFLFVAVLFIFNTIYDQNLGFSSFSIIAPLTLIIIKILADLKAHISMHKSKSEISFSK